MAEIGRLEATSQRFTVKAEGAHTRLVIYVVVFMCLDVVAFVRWPINHTEAVYVGVLAIVALVQTYRSYSAWWHYRLCARLRAEDADRARGHLDDYIVAEQAR